MTVTLKGSFSLGGAFPLLASVQAALFGTASDELAAASLDGVDIEAQLPTVQASVDGLTSQLKAVADIIAQGPAGAVSAALSFAASGQLAAGLQTAGPQLLAALQASLSNLAALQAAATASLGGLVAKQAVLEARIGALKVALSLAKSVATSLGKAGARVYVYTGPLADLGAEVGAYINGGGNDSIPLATSVWVPIIVTDNPSTQASLQTMLPP